MTIEIDLSAAVRRPADQRALVQAIIDAAPEDEAHWIEWKSTLRLDANEGRFAIARQILGFANRHPDRAKRFADGCAYVLVGAEPGNAPGVERIDVADLDQGLRRYLGEDGPLWTADYITAPAGSSPAGSSVLLITVDPPRWGDRIFTLRKTYQASGKDDADEGTVFVRREARTVRAGSADIRMLEDRLLGTTPVRSPELLVRRSGDPSPLVPLAVTDDLCRAWLEDRRRHLLRSLRRREGLPRGTRTAEFIEQLSALGAMGVGEDRSPEEYRAEVDRYLSWVEKHLDEMVVDRFARSGRNVVQLVVDNDSDRNLPDVELTLYVPGLVAAVDPDGPPTVRVVPPPRPFGTAKPFMSPVGRLALPATVGLGALHSGLDIDNGGSATIRMRLGNIRPRATVSTEPFVLLVTEPPGTMISSTWRATSVGVDGIREGVLDLEVAGDVVRPSDVIAPTEDAES